MAVGEYGSLISLIHDLDQIERLHACGKIDCDAELIRNLQLIVRALVFFLESTNSRELCPEMEALIRQISPSVDEAQFIIGKLVVDQFRGAIRSEVVPSLSHALYEVIRKLECIYEGLNKLLREKGVSRMADPDYSDSVAIEDVQFEWEDQLQWAIDKLTSDDQSRRVISIFGEAGVDITTFARSLYNHPRIEKRFDKWMWWCTISEKYNVKENLQVILGESCSGEAPELGLEVHKKLYNRRYFVVLDDVQQIKAWEEINIRLPDCGKGSRILVTTRNQDVANASSGDKTNICALGYARRLYAFKKTHACPNEIEEIGKDVAKLQIVRSKHTSSKVVRFQNELQEVFTCLFLGPSKLNVIPIVGMGGIGKTTLAQLVFDHTLAQRHFHIRLWCTVSKNYDVKVILQDLLKDKSNHLSYRDLSAELHHRLWHRRYLVILDDIWDIDAWKSLRDFFPDYHNGSLILVTTRSSRVSEECRSSDFVCRLDPWDDSKSWEFLREKIFGEEDCPVDLKEIGKKIAKACGGLPLSLVAIAGVISKSSMTATSWKGILKNMSSEIEEIGNKDVAELQPVRSKHTSSKMVGFENELNEVITQIYSYHWFHILPEFNVIPIVGMGGIGKTTLAQLVFNHPGLQRYFDIRLWCTVSKNYDVKVILQDLLKDKSNHLSDHELAFRLFKVLCPHRYLVILDDIWDIDAWNSLRDFFPDNLMGSAILVTTRSLRVSEECRSRDFVCRLDPWDDSKSWEFLREKIFGQDDCPVDLKEIGKKIAKACGGLPLSLVAIAGVISKSSMTATSWEGILKNMRSSEIEEIGNKDVAELQPVRSKHTSKVVGFENELEEVITQIHSYDRFHMRPEFNVIPIVGMGGIGKTTLAQLVFNHPEVQRRFGIRLWCTVSKNYDLRAILHDLLKYWDESNHLSDVDELGTRLHIRLRRRRYLVILDDIWDIDAWISLRDLFPDDRNGSLILVTTRSSRVSEECRSSDFVCRLDPWDDSKSWEFLREKIFGQDDCPVDLKEIGKKIAKACGGLPLSLVAIAGVISKSSMTATSWEGILKNMRSSGSIDGRHVLEVLSLSYYALPMQLKPCFLYFRNFHEDAKIRVSVLLREWIAEGYVQSTQNKTIPKIANEYFNNLVDRNLVLIVRRNSLGEIKECGVHDLVLDVCIQESFKETFPSIPRFMVPWFKENKTCFMCYFYVKDGEGERICVPQIDGAISSSVTDILVCKKCEKKCPSVEKLILVNFLDKKLPTTLRSVDCKSDFDEVEVLPSTMLYFWNLQFLVLNLEPTEVEESDVEFLGAIWDMPQLRYVDIGRVPLPSPPPKANSSFTVLSELEKLSAFDLVLSDELIKRIPNIESLKLRHSHYLDCSDWCLHLLAGFQKLQSLCIDGFYDLAENKVCFPPGLKKLTLNYVNICWDTTMQIVGSLRNLQLLKLINVGDDETSEWKMRRNEFERLKTLVIRNTDLNIWEVKDYLPDLESLVLEGAKNLEIPNLSYWSPRLREMHLNGCGERTRISSRALMEENCIHGGDLKLYFDGKLQSGHTTEFD